MSYYARCPSALQISLLMLVVCLQGGGSCCSKLSADDALVMQFLDAEFIKTDVFKCGDKSITSPLSHISCDFLYTIRPRHKVKVRAEWNELGHSAPYSKVGRWESPSWPHIPALGMFPTQKLPTYLSLSFWDISATCLIC